MSDIVRICDVFISGVLLYPWFLSLWSTATFGENDKRHTSTMSALSRTAAETNDENAMTTTASKFERAKQMTIHLHEPEPEHEHEHEHAYAPSLGPGGLREVVRWKQIEIEYPSEKARQIAIETGRFVAENNLPLGLHVFKDKIFVTLPKWKDGVPVTLGVIGKDEGPSPSIKPYPDWSWHSGPQCDGLTSVFRIDVDACDRLWVLDSGIVDAENTVNQLCPPQIFIFNLETDKLVRRYIVPRDQSPDSSLLSNIVVEVLEDCENVYAYLGDVFRYGLIVYSYKANRSWRVTHSYFYPDPLASDYILDGIEFQWVDGLFGMALSPPDGQGSRLLYFHPLSSYREFSVPTYILRNESLGFGMNKHFKVVGQPRGQAVSHSTGSAMDRNGVLFYNLLTKSAVACWNSNSFAYDPTTQAILYQNNETLSFPNDLRVDAETEQTIWVLSNRLHRFLYDRLDPNDVNFRILSAHVKELVRGTVCDFQILYHHTARKPKIAD